MEKFDSLIAAFDGVVMETTTLYSSQRWPGCQLEPVLFFDGERPVCAALVMRKCFPFRLGQISVVKWGPIHINAMCVNRSAVYREVIEHLKTLCCQAPRSMISILPHVETVDTFDATAQLIDAGFKQSKQLPFPSRYLVNISLTDEEQRKSFSQKWRYHLNKSEKQKLAFEVAAPDQFERFAELYESMSDRKQFPDYSAYGTLQHFFEHADASLRPQLFFVTKDGEDLAGAVIFKAGRTAVYLYGATNDRALPLRAGYFMHARIISWLRDNTKAVWYDLGGSDGFLGLHQFKKGMVGNAGRIIEVPPATNYARTRGGWIVGLTAFAMRDVMVVVREKIRRLMNAGLAKPDLERTE